MFPLSTDNPLFVPNLYYLIAGTVMLAATMSLLAGVSRA